MTEFVKQEFLRLIDLLPQTDPRTNEYLTLLHSIECFDSIANSVDEIDGLRKVDLSQGEYPAEQPKIVEVVGVAPFTTPDFPAETPEEQEGHEVAELVKKVVEAQSAPPKLKLPEEEKIDPSEVRKALVAARARGIDSKEILSGFGVTHFQELPANKYRALLDALEVI